MGHVRVPLRLITTGRIVQLDLDGLMVELGALEGECPEEGRLFRLLRLVAEQVRHLDVTERLSGSSKTYKMIL